MKIFITILLLALILNVYCLQTKKLIYFLITENDIPIQGSSGGQVKLFNKNITSENLIQEINTTFSNIENIKIYGLYKPININNIIETDKIKIKRATYNNNEGNVYNQIEIPSDYDNYLNDCINNTRGGICGEIIILDGTKVN